MYRYKYLEEAERGSRLVQVCTSKIASWARSSIMPCSVDLAVLGMVYSAKEPRGSVVCVGTDGTDVGVAERMRGSCVLEISGTRMKRTEDMCCGDTGSHDFGYKMRRMSTRDSGRTYPLIEGDTRSDSMYVVTPDTGRCHLLLKVSRISASDGLLDRSWNSWCDRGGLS